MKPVIAHTKISQPALPVREVIFELTMKIPDPIMDPATIMVPSSNPNVGLNEGAAGIAASEVVLVVAAIAINITKSPRYNQIISIFYRPRSTHPPGRW